MLRNKMLKGVIFVIKKYIYSIMSATSTSVPVVITPYNAPIRYINSFTYSVRSFELSVQITFSVFLYDENGNYIDNAIITLAGDDYKEWGNDDNYIKLFIANQLGLILA